MLIAVKNRSSLWHVLIIPEIFAEIMAAIGAIVFGAFISIALWLYEKRTGKRSSNIAPGW